MQNTPKEINQVIVAEPWTVENDFRHVTLPRLRRGLGNDGADDDGGHVRSRCISNV